MTAEERLAQAWALLDRADEATAGLWPRAAALLARQALEQTIYDFWSVELPPMCAANMRAQILGLHGYPGVREHAPAVNAAWFGLSRGCHHHPYELPPIRAELAGWFEIVDEFGAVVRRELMRPR
ncbi:MAG TPA: hypothetical protein VIL35_11480 [Vicinamibacterales bacterium]